MILRDTYGNTDHVDADETTSLLWLYCKTTEDENRNQVVLGAVDYEQVAKARSCELM